MKTTLSILLMLLSFARLSSAQFAPQYPLEGNDAIHKSDTRIKAWASEVVDFQRSYMQITDTALGLASAGSPSNALGMANSTIVSLGDGGSITLRFDQAIKNGPGADFAVFENAFANPLDSALAFLELAFVEVSTDGVNFVRFPAISYLQTDSQITNETYSQASKINNLAGKYVSNYGTPFDLEQLKDSTGIDIDQIFFVRIIDVVGILNNKYTQYDHYENPINDPWPTPFPSSGFDLDAVAVLYQNPSAILEETWATENFKIYPNPCNEVLHISWKSTLEIQSYYISDLQGKILLQGKIKNNQSVSTQALLPGLYYFHTAGFSLPFVKL